MPIPKKIRLSFEKEFKSIKDFPDTELPPFSILTGANGCGKTHLLKAIEQGTVKVDGIESRMRKIALFNWSSFAPKIDSSSNALESKQKFENSIQNTYSKIVSISLELAGYFKSKRITGSNLLTDVEFLKSASPAEIEKALNGSHSPRHPGTKAQEFAKEYEAFRQSKITSLVTDLDNSHFGLGTKLLNVAKASNKEFTVLSKVEVKYNMPVFTQRQEPLQLQLASWFSSWHELWEQNKYYRYLSESENHIDRTYIPKDEDFIKVYGDKPWDLVNRVMEISGLPYRFNHPEIDTPHFALRLKNQFNGDLIEVDSLSSGEKILLALILFVHQGHSTLGTLAVKPELLLLDEIDGPLHPSFTKILIKTINEELVQRLGISVIMTTHSPSTVALAPHGSIFELVQNPRRVHPISVTQATQILSAGFISITPNDIIVITESNSDADYYNKAFQGLVRNSFLNESPSLRFLAASKKSDDGKGGGCDQVKNWAPKLNDLGLNRFRGLIDRDTGNTESDNIKVIKRYCIENYVFDPVVIIAFLIHRGINAPFGGSKIHRNSADALLHMSETERQILLDLFFAWLAGESGESAISTSPKIEILYNKLGVLRIPSWWMDSKKQELLKAITPQLNKLSHSLNRGPIVRGDREEISDFAFNSFPEAIPQDLIGIFQRLQAS